MLTLLSFVFPLVLGDLALRLVEPRPVGNRLLRGSLAVGIGLGLTSVLFFLWTALDGRSLTSLLAMEIGVSAALLGLFLLRRPAGSAPRAPAAPRPLLFAALTATAIAVVDFALSVQQLPHGDGDAMAIWNIRALYLVRAPGEWPLIFSPEVPAADYPLLIPALVARAWQYAGAGSGAESVVAPALIAGAFTFATAGLLAGALSELRSPGQACIGILALFATPLFLRQGVAQMADVPLAYYMLATLCLLGTRAPAGPALAAMSAALAAWTKNEGLVFAVLVLGLFLIRRRGELAPALIGGLAPAMAVAWFKLALSPGNALVSGMTWQRSLDQLMDPARYLSISEHLIQKAVWFQGGDSAAGNGPAVMLVFALLVGRPREGPGLRLPGRWLPALMLLAYLGIYLVTPQDLVWTLSVSGHRLLLHLWPSILLIVLSELHTPEEVLAEEPVASRAGE